MTRVPPAWRRRAALLIAAVALGGATVSAKVKFTSSWNAPEAAGVSFAGKKVAALVIVRDVSLRYHAEEQLATLLTERGIVGTAAYRVVPNEELQNTANARAWLEKSGVDGVVVLRPVSVEQKRTYEPAWSQPNYATLWGYYPYGWTVVYDPGAVRDDTILVVETLVYSVARDKLLWGGISETTNPKSAREFISDLIKAAVKEMKKKRLIE